MTRSILLPPVRRVYPRFWDGDKLPEGVGSSRPQMIVDDSAQVGSWVVKSINSHQGSAGLGGRQAAFNEYLASRLAEAVGFPVAEVGIMHLDSEFLDDNPELKTADKGRFTEGDHIAIKYYPGCESFGTYADGGLQLHLKAKCTNLEHANAIAAFDSATCNWDRAIPHQGRGLLDENHDNLLVMRTNEGSLRLLMIDQGYCFAANWDANDPPTSLSSLKDWPLEIFGMFRSLTRIGAYDESSINQYIEIMKHLTVAQVKAIIGEIPSDWKAFTDEATIDQFVLHLLHRISRYDLIVTSKFSSTKVLAHG